METLLAAVFVIFLLLFAVLNLSHAFMTSQDMVQVAWAEMETRRSTQDNTSLDILDAYTTDLGRTLNITLANDGEQPLMDFDHWDVIVQYDDASVKHIDWLPYGTTPNGWMVGDIMLQVENGEPIAEFYNRGILDPGESIAMTIRLSPAAAPSTGILTRITAPNGASTIAMFLSNAAPTLVANNGLMLDSGSAAAITSADLNTTDQDGDDLLYTITNPPTLGTLSFIQTFTQGDIDAGRLMYTNYGTTGTDGFDFTVTDGKDTLGPYTFSLTVSTPNP